MAKACPRLTLKIEPHSSTSEDLWIVAYKAGTKTQVGELRVRPLFHAPDRLDVVWSSVNEDYLRCGVGTKLYERAWKLGCKLGRYLRSDTTRSTFAEAFWRKQGSKRRAVCVKRKGARGERYTATHPGEDVYDYDDPRIQRFMQQQRRFSPHHSTWPCRYWQLKTMCPRGRGTLRGRR